MRSCDPVYLATACTSAASGPAAGNGCTAPPQPASAAKPAPSMVIAHDEAVHRHQAVLCVHNLSRFAQPAELALAKWAGATPYEVLGRVPFPVVTEEPYAVTLPPYGFLWFDLALEEGQPQE